MNLFDAREDAARALPHLRIMASAGSGKTHQLANRYVRLLLEGVDPARILASTFTRMAAGEIQQKILKRLIVAADDAEELAELARQLEMPELTAGEVVAAIRRLAQQVHRLNIRTLDSFFAGVTTAFGYELGIPPGSVVVEEERAIGLRAEAIRRMLDERDPESIIEILRRVTQGSSETGVTRRIDSVVTDLYHISRDSDAATWAKIPMCGGRLREADLVEAIERLRAVEVPAKFDSAHAKALKQATHRSWENFVGVGYPAKIAAGETLFSRVEIPGDLIDAATPIVNHAKAVLVNNWRDECIGTREVLDLFDTQYRQVKREQGVLTFDDLTTAMRQAVKLDLTDLWFRLDASIDHMLLDEFQDTSVQQWEALQPLISEIVSFAPPERSFFCVGDIKQSIYGWRDAAPEILQTIHALLGRDEETLQTKPLSHSWRSAQPIITVVNSVFESLGRNEALDDLPEVADEWSGWFNTHHTHLSALPGRVELRLSEYHRGTKERGRRRCRAAADLASQLHAEHPNASIALLTRSNDMAARLLYLLGPAGHDLPCSGRGGGPLVDAPAVVAVLDLLRLAQYPDHTVAAFNVETSPLEAVVDRGERLVRDKGARRRTASELRLRLARDGYATTIADLMRPLVASLDERQFRRMLQLIDVAEQFDRDASGDAADFIRIAENLAVPETRPAPIQVMNIHQSKGLQFDIVILPELDERLTDGRTVVVVERDGATGPIQTVVRRRKSEVRQFVPELEPIFTEQKHREARESLCLLYVAMTRARQGLYMLVDELSKTKKLTASMSNVVLGALAPDPSIHRLDKPVHTTGGELTIVTAEEPASPPEALGFKRPAIDPSRIRSGARAVRPSSAGFSHRLSARLAPPDVDALARGTLMHAWMESIEWLDDAELDESALRDIGAVLLPRRSEHWIESRVEEFVAALQRSDVRAVMSEPAGAAARFEVRREWPFARLVDGRVQQGSIDRLILETDAAGSVTTAHVIDFKSDHIVAADAISVAEKYRRQLEIYREVAAVSHDLDPTNVRATVVFMEPGVCVDLDVSQPAG